MRTVMTAPELAGRIDREVPGMAKRWKSMDQAERDEYVGRLDAVTDGMVALFAADDTGPELWERFTAYSMSVGSVLDARNMVRAFAQHVRTGNAKPSDMRSWSQWTAAGRTPVAKRDVVVFTSYPSHLWDIADTTVTDRKAWRKATKPAAPEDGAVVLADVAALVMDGHGVDLTAGLPALPEPAADETPTDPREVQRARLRSEGYTGSLEAMMRAEWATEAARLHDVAEDVTRGHMRNPRGLRKDVDTTELITNTVQAKAYASEELRAWFNDNGGVFTFANWRARLLGEPVVPVMFADVKA